MAIAAATRYSASTSRRTVFIDLSVIRDPALVASATATALGLPVLSSDPLPSIVRYLAAQWDLLVLDNCEHVIEHAAILAESVLRGAPSVRVLATSREPCGFAKDFVHWLPPLAVPPVGHADPLTFPAAQLFLERSRLRRPDLDPDVQGAALVGEVCRKLDGLPLAIELVATRVGAVGLDSLSMLLQDGGCRSTCEPADRHAATSNDAGHIRMEIQSSNSR